MKTTLVISLDEESTALLSQQQIDPSAFINELLHQEKQRLDTQGTGISNNLKGQIMEAAPSASRNKQQTISQTLEAISDLDTQAAD